MKAVAKRTNLANNNMISAIEFLDGDSNISIVRNVCLTTKPIAKDHIVLLWEGTPSSASSPGLLFENKHFLSAKNPFEVPSAENLYPKLIVVYDRDLGYQHKLFFCASEDLPEGAAVYYDLSGTDRTRAIHKPTDSQDSGLAESGPQPLPSPGPSGPTPQPSQVRKSKKQLFCDNEAEVSGSGGSADESEHDTDTDSEEPVEDGGRDEQVYGAKDILAAVFSSYSLVEKITLVRMIYSITSNERRAGFDSAIMNSLLAVQLPLLKTHGHMGKVKFEIAKSTYCDVKTLMFSGENFWQCLCRVFSITTSRPQVSERASVSLASILGKRPILSAPSTPQKHKQLCTQPSTSTPNRDIHSQSIILASPIQLTMSQTTTTEVTLTNQVTQTHQNTPRHSQAPVWNCETPSLLRYSSAVDESVLQTDSCTMLRSMTGDNRDDHLPFRDKTYLRNSCFPETRAKIFLCLIPGDKLICHDTDKINSILPRAFMGLMCAEKIKGEEQQTLLLIKTDKDISLKTLSFQVTSLISDFGIEPGSCMLCALTAHGYMTYYGHMQKNLTCIEVGELDEKARRKLKLEDGEISNAFIKLCDYAEKHNVEPNVAQINSLFENIPFPSQEHKCITKVRQSAGQYKCCVENTKWMLIQREMARTPELKDRTNWLTCKMWDSLYQDYIEYCDANDCCTLHPPDLEDETTANWIRERLFDSKTVVEQILLANGIPPTTFVNAVMASLKHGTRRERCVVFYSEQHRCGKSIVADGFMKLMNGKRITLEDNSSREFIVSSASSSGLVVIEDPSAPALDYMVRSMRPHLDGDVVPVNTKHQAITHAQYPPIYVTTNIKNTTRALESRSVSFTFTKTMEEIFGNRRVDHISASEIASFLAKYTFFPMCNAIYSELIPMVPGYIYTQCVHDSLYGHSPACRFMLYCVRVADKVTLDPQTVVHGRCQRSTYHSIERIRPLNCGAFCTQTAVSTARMYMLQTHRCLQRGDTTGLKILPDQAVQAYHIEEWYKTVMLTFSALFYQLILSDSDFHSGPCPGVRHICKSVHPIRSTQFYSDLANDLDERVGQHNPMSRAEFDIRDHNGSYHQHLAGKLLTVSRKHGMAGNSSASGQFTVPVGTTLATLYNNLFGRSLMMARESPPAPAESDLFG